MYYFYILRCADNSLYCGMTARLERRIREHNSTGRGARYTRAKKPAILVHSEIYPDIKAAMGREAEVKRWTKAKKEALVWGNRSNQT